MSSMRSSIFALIDCNNFYASCERIFNPKLNAKPIVVLSNNDGCVIARSNEAKLLGIQMGQPYFQIERLCHQYHVSVFSSNFALYGDISERVMATLHDLCPDMEIYSIDEAFVQLDNISAEPYSYAVKIRETILRNIGIPVSIGIAPTKTLAKVATYIAKKNTSSGVFDCRSSLVRESILNSFPVGEVWGIGRKTSEKLEKMNIKTVNQLCSVPSDQLKRNFNITLARIVLELQGDTCLFLEEMTNRKNIMSSRSFAKPTKNVRDIIEAVSVYAGIACEKARKQKTKAQGICVYLRTSPFSKNQPYYAASKNQLLTIPSNDTMMITETAHQVIKKILKSGLCYQKVGIILLDLIPDHFQQNDFFEYDANQDNQKLMSLIDAINLNFGAHTLFLGAEGVAKQWQTKQANRSKRYTTCWDELVYARIVR